MIRRVQDSNIDYHSNELLGTTAIVSGYDAKTGQVNLAKVKSYLDGMSIVSASRQKAFDLGTVQHSAILEQDMSEVKLMPDFEPIPGKTSKEQKEDWLRIYGDDGTGECPNFKPVPSITKKSQEESFRRQNPAKFYLKKKDYDNVLGAFEVISEHTAAARMISNALNVETSYYDEKEGIKCRPDIVGMTESGGLFICNYKTINDLSKCHSHIYSLNYDLRAAQEINIVARSVSERVQHYFFLFQEKTAPYSIRCIELSDIDREIAIDEWVKCKNMVKAAIKSNKFPQPPFIIEQSKVYRNPEEVQF